VNTLLEEWEAADINKLDGPDVPIPKLGDIPLTVISMTQTVKSTPSEQVPASMFESVQLFKDLQAELAGLSTKGKQVFAENSGHYIQLERPDVVHEAIQAMVHDRRGMKMTP
jgi:pimeloyl-ACP methyl ester carboxylesterase